MSAPTVPCGGELRTREVTLPDGLAVLARSAWPASGQAELPATAGFITSAFSPLAAAVADLCMRSYFGSPPADHDRGERTAIVLASSTGDIVTAAAIASAVDEGRRVPPLLFFQSNPNAVAGYIAARWGLTGPVVCTNPYGDPMADAMISATLLIEDGDASAALIVIADAGRAGDLHGAALLVGPAFWPPACARPDPAAVASSGDPPSAARKARVPQR